MDRISRHPRARGSTFVLAAALVSALAGAPLPSGPAAGWASGSSGGSSAGSVSGLAGQGALDGIERILEAADLDRIELRRCRAPGGQEPMLCGRLEVPENRVDGTGRTIALSLVVLPARDRAPRPDPVFYLMGGPGGAATLAVRGHRDSWMREERDLVFIDQRGTGGSNPLDCALPGGSTGPGARFDPPFASAGAFHRCAERLARRADLRYYTTPLAVDDFDDVREALGYERVNLMGGSYGSRAALVYMRRHPGSVRAAVLNGIAPIAFANPLYHAAEAQAALDRTFAGCAADDACNDAFPGLAGKFDELLARLEAEPVRLELVERGGGSEPLLLTRDRFAEALRVFLYRMPRARRVPLMIHRAWEGDFGPLVRAVVESDGLGAALQIGTLLAVTCSEDVPRIAEADIVDATAHTFLGDGRVRRQMAACEGWPRGWVADDHGEPVTSAVPTLLFSGTLDPVTGPRWGEEAASHLVESLHVVVPGAHGVGGPCVTGITRRFLRDASVDDVDTSCVARMELPPFVLR